MLEKPHNLDWSDIFGQKFNDSDARKASDFDEILANFSIDPDNIASLFPPHQELDTPKRLVIAIRSCLDDAVRMFLNDSDDRIRAVIQARISEEKCR